MDTQCTPTQLEFHAIGNREVVGKFDGGNLTSDAGGLLLRETEKRTGILSAFARCFEDLRDPDLIEHTVEELVPQRVYGLALGYEDLNDHDDFSELDLKGISIQEGKRKSPCEGQKKGARPEAGAGSSTMLSFFEHDGRQLAVGK